MSVRKFCLFQKFNTIKERYNIIQYKTIEKLICVSAHMYVYIWNTINLMLFKTKFHMNVINTLVLLIIEIKESRCTPILTIPYHIVRILCNVSTACNV